MNKNSKVVDDLLNAEIESDKEVKIILRLTNKNQIRIINWLKRWCKQNNNGKLNNYLANVILEHAQDVMKSVFVPDLPNTLYAVTRKAVYAGTLGMNSFTAKAIQPIVTQSELTDVKLNFIINLLCNSVDKEKFKDIQNPPNESLKEHQKFKTMRVIIDNRFQKDIENLKKRSKRDELKSDEFASSVSFKEFINSKFEDVENIDE